MAITDELREYADGFSGPFYGHGERLRKIADRIDERHEQTYRNLTDALHKQEEATYKLSEKSIMLPVDADGVPIRIGDVVTCGANVWTVTRMKLLGGGWGICCTVYNEHGCSSTNVYPPSDLRHYHEPTVEDVLRQFADAMSNTNPLDVPARIAEYAAKLRLAEEVDA